ncbi:MAG: isocitrate dehydrogenase (NADP(+)) [bacterium]|jgi:isocitrate dehydrogenase
MAKFDISFEKLPLPASGEKFTFDSHGDPVTPDNPIVCLIEGDGIGRSIGGVPGITETSVKVIDAAVQKSYGGNRKIEWFKVHAGDASREIYFPNVTDDQLKGLPPQRQRDCYLPEDTLKAIDYFKVALKGPLTTPIGGGFSSINVALRQIFDLYVCLRPVRHYPGVPAPNINAHKVDMHLFRENSEDVYMGVEEVGGSERAQRIINLLNEELGYKDRLAQPIKLSSGIGIKPISPEGTKRLVRRAIKYAINLKLPSVTLVHKGNIMKFTEGAFKNWGYEIAKAEFRDKIVTEDELWAEDAAPRGGAAKGDANGRIVVKDRIADSMFQQVQLRPDEYSVIATPNLNGDYLSDALAACVGGLGLAPGANIGDGAAIFEATHGTAPKYTGQDKANPGSVILSGVLMLKWMGWVEAGELIDRAIGETIRESADAAARGEWDKLFVTYDIARQFEGGSEKYGVKASKFGERIIEHLA